MAIQRKKSIRKRYSPEQKAQIVLENLKEEQTLAQISASSGIHVNQLRKWKTQAIERLPRVFTGETQAVRATEAAQEQERQTVAYGNISIVELEAVGVDRVRQPIQAVVSARNHDLRGVRMEIRRLLRTQQGTGCLWLSLSKAPTRRNRLIRGLFRTQ